MNITNHKDRRRADCNRRFAKKRVQYLNEALCFVSSSVLADSLVVAESSELQTNPDNRVAKKFTHCQYVARYAAF